MIGVKSAVRRHEYVGEILYRISFIRHALIQDLHWVLLNLAQVLRGVDQPSTTHRAFYDKMLRIVETLFNASQIKKKSVAPESIIF